MSCIKSIIIGAVCVCMGPLGWGIGPTHFTTSKTGRLARYTATGPNVTILRTSATLCGITFTESALGKLMYVEITPEHSDWRNGPWAFSTCREAEYDPNLIAYRLHICDATGKDLQIVPIPETYGSIFGDGRFYGETFVGFQNIGRTYGKGSELFVSLESGRLFYWGRTFDTIDEEMVASCSPDGRALVWVAYLPAKRWASVCVNGVQIYPYYTESVPSTGMRPSVYKQAISDRDQWLKDHPGDYYLEQLTYGPIAWSPDSRYVAFLRTPKSATKQTTVTLQAVALDIESAGPGKSLESYCQTVEVEVPRALIFDIYRPLATGWDSARRGFVVRSYEELNASLQHENETMEGTAPVFVRSLPFKLNINPAP